MRWILCSLLLTLTQHSFCSPWMKESFWLSSLIREEAHFLRPQLPQWQIWWVWADSTANLRQGVTILDATESIHDSWGEVKYQHQEDFGRSRFQPSWTILSRSEKISEKEMTTDVVNSQKTRLGMEPELRFAQPAGSCSHYTADALSLVISLT